MKGDTVFLAAYSRAGRALLLEVKAKLSREGVKAQEFSGELTAEIFEQAGALVFICACGIAVRKTAPFVKDKLTDPAVVVMDELGLFCISLLSGHAGGANRLARWLASGFGSTPVVTTATDIRGVFAADVFAQDNGLVIGDRRLAKEVSSALLNGGPVYVKNELGDGLLLHRRYFDQLIPWEEGGAPAPAGNEAGRETTGILIGNGMESPFDKTLYLRPKNLVVGMGCRRGKSAEELSGFLDRVLSSRGLFRQQVVRLCSADLKRDEPGLLKLAESLGVTLQTYSAAKLEAAEGVFGRSEFVYRAAGTGNVCERSAALGSGGGELLIRKTSEHGMTIAVGVISKSKAAQK